MQFMRNLTQTEPCFVGAEAICDREGQVLSVHAAPLGLSVGDYLTDRMTAAERRFFAGLSHDAICLCRKQAVLCLRRQFNGLLVRCIPLSAPPQAVAARKEQVSSLGLVLSPGLLALDALQTDDGEAAHELIRFCGMGLHAHGRLTADALRPTADDQTDGWYDPRRCMAGHALLHGGFPLPRDKRFGARAVLDRADGFADGAFGCRCADLPAVGEKPPDYAGQVLPRRTRIGSM